MTNIIIALLSGNIITFFLGRLWGRKKNKLDEEGKRLGNLETTIEIYERVHNELKEQLSNLSDKCSKLSGQIEQLQSENEKLKKEIHTLNNKLNEKNKEY